MVQVSEDMDHSLERMTQHACRLLSDADVIADHQSDHANGHRGEYLLRLMALEILMKAAALRHEGQLRNFSHNFSELFAAQSEDVQDDVKHEFGARGMEKRGFDTGSPLHKQLERLKLNYTRARYVYEPSIQLTRNERLAREQAFLDGTLPPDEWDLIYHHGLIELLTKVVLDHLASWVPGWYAP